MKKCCLLILLFSLWILPIKPISEDSSDYIREKIVPPIACLIAGPLFTHLAYIHLVNNNNGPVIERYPSGNIERLEYNSTMNQYSVPMGIGCAITAGLSYLMFLSFLLRGN